ncbi:Flp family type IVb pilin [Vibrio sp. SCSIO 43137]|uniref:Flp family type IVb pilin n=1 Tax=Vibrio sp. SCSIO 43137 TaxID=3021011 RepID=UPI0023077535|nr:Flp family type IVb pilin [Vibrio sp. SCSIO 43137]WCE32554.1 Flp family type IVb pilin [Vibrio sp. SCSIO 43137]
MLYDILARIELIKGRFTHDERGVTAVEYAIVAVAMSAVVLAVYTNGDLVKAMKDAMAEVGKNISAAKTVPTK